MIKIQCEMCGSEERLFRALIEGTELNVCKNCSGFGKITGKVKEKSEEVKEKKAKKIEIPKIEVVEIIVSDFAKRIKSKRELLGLNQKEFAKRINEKESIIHKLETGDFTPSISLARKIEGLVGIKLTEQYEEEHKKIAGEAAKEVTIGDLIKIKKR